MLETRPQVFSPKVLAVGFNPSDGNRNIAQTYFHMEGKTPGAFEDYVFNDTINAFKQFSNNSINYQVVQKISVNTFPKYTNGHVFTIDNYAECVHGRPGYNPSKCESIKFAFDHESWLKDNKICETADQLGVDEVWIMSAPYIMAWESFMFGPGKSFSVNAPSYTTMQCKKHYIVMNPSYERSGPFLHIYGHRIESIMNYLTSIWHSTDKIKYWENFSGTGRYASPLTPYNTSVCGNAHFAMNSTQSYDYSSYSYADFNCTDWKNFPNFTGITENINCTKWGCNDLGWQKLWFGSIPRNIGETALAPNCGTTIKFRNNWWYYLLYPEHAIRYKETYTTGVSTFSNLKATLASDRAEFSFDSSIITTPYYVEMSQRPDLSYGVYVNFANGNSCPLTVINPQAKWDQYRCGNTMYWRVYTSASLRMSEIQKAVINCSEPTLTPTRPDSSTPTRLPTSTPTPKPTNTTVSYKQYGDLNNDKRVDLIDLSILSQYWGTGNSNGDINSDGRVDIIDLSVLASNWGKAL
jgi:hypothetical protein